MKSFKTPESTQRFLASIGSLLNLLKVKRYVYCAKEYRIKLQGALKVFQDIVTYALNLFKTRRLGFL